MVAPHEVHDILRRHMLTDGFEFVLDTEASRGSWLIDAREGTRYLDMFSFYGSNALGMNHPALAQDEQFRAVLGSVALNKPPNSGVYTTHLAEFVDTFVRVLGDPRLPHLFLIEGGAVAVENALKIAFDWKSRRNAAAGRSEQLGTQVMHLTRAFHGRTGYTMSLTNSAPVKVARYPQFSWPRIPVPAVSFPIEAHREAIVAAERAALWAAEAAFEANPHDIACFIAEPIQSEGGDNHMRAQFLHAMQLLCHRYDALFILDEVQTGCGLSGTAWTYQQLGLAPDLVVFGKKLQVCGVMAGGRVDEVPDNALRVSSRLGSTWGGNLTDMVRARRILEVIESEHLIARVAALGEQLAAELHALQEEFPTLLSNARGRGLIRAVDLPTSEARDKLIARLATEERVLALPCGPRSLRFRPLLTVTREELRLATEAVRRVAKRLEL